MIDTIILNIPVKDVKMLDEKIFDVQPWNLQSQTATYQKYVKNPTAKALKSGQYFPRLTGYNRNSDVYTEAIKIEFSAPKLLFLNNLDELTEKQFMELIKILQDRLKQMGVEIPYEKLENAAVSAVHYSKNIELGGGFTSQYVIAELNKINLSKRFDMAKARYINDGQSLYAYTTAHSLVIYDKIADLNKGKKKSMDKEQNSYQMNLFESLNNKVEILRIEARLSQKQKLNSFFKQLGYNTNPTFKDVFSEEKSRKVLMWYWEKLFESQSSTLFAFSVTNKDLLKQILLARPNLKGRQAIYLAGLGLLAKDGNGLRELRSILSKRNNDRTWYRILDDLKEITAELGKLKPREWCEQIKKQINHYSPLTLSHLK